MTATADVLPAVCCEGMRRHLDDLPGDRQGLRFDGVDWFVYGCCHGGCCVLVGIRFCPFCGIALQPVQDT